MSSKTKALVLLMLVLSVLPLMAAGKQEENTGDFSGEIKLHFMTPMTSNIPMATERTKQGAQMRADEINAKGGILGKKIVLVYEDEGDQTSATNVANKLTSQKDTIFVMGPIMSGNAIAIDPIAKRSDVIFLLGGTSPKISDLKNPNYFRMRSSDGLNARTVSQFAVESLGAKKVGIVYANNDFGVGGRDVIIKYCQDKNIEYVVQGLNQGDKDLTGQISKLISANVDVVIPWANDSELALLARQSYDMKIGVPFVSVGGISNQQVLDLVESEHVEGWYAVTDFCINDSDPTIVEFVQKFKNRYGVEAEGIYSSAHYNAVGLIAHLIEKTGSTDKAVLRKELGSLKNYPSLFGPLSSDVNRDLVHTVKIVQIKNKQPHVVQTISESI